VVPVLKPQPVSAVTDKGTDWARGSGNAGARKWTWVLAILSSPLFMHFTAEQIESQRNGGLSKRQKQQGSVSGGEGYRKSPCPWIPG
jgi:hypothetical protein